VSSLAQTRIAFGKAISSYQGVKHQAADMLVAIENAKSLAYYAAWAVNQDLDETPLAVPLAPSTDRRCRAAGKR
jgi:alkylation response protein AidB-like acyl-CoA dehydrogenase